MEATAASAPDAFEAGPWGEKSPAFWHAARTVFAIHFGERLRWWRRERRRCCPSRFGDGRRRRQAPPAHGRLGRATPSLRQLRGGFRDTGAMDSPKGYSFSYRLSESRSAKGGPHT
ncbi:MAG: hypothetical protein OXH92_08635 [Bryobacterales bacterium]|nr:hypothetical protein [Bryobacterales bacterium]